MISIRRFLTQIRRFRTAQSGVAAVEFALIVPIMIALYVGANEASVLVSVDRKVQLISGVVGDLVSRSDGTITAANLNDYVKVASGVAAPYPVPDMIQIVSQLKVDSNGRATVDWSRGYHNQAPAALLKRTDNSEYKLTAAMAEISKGKYIILAETKVPYIPLGGIVFKTSVTLYHATLFMPRFDGPIRPN